MTKLNIQTRIGAPDRIDVEVVYERYDSLLEMVVFVLVGETV